MNNELHLITIGTQMVAVDKSITEIKEGELMSTHEGVEKAGYDGFCFENVEEFCLKLIASIEPIDPSIPLIPRSVFNNWLSVTQKLPDKEGIYTVKRAYSTEEEKAEFTGKVFTNYDGYAVKFWKVGPKAIIPEMEWACSVCDPNRECPYPMTDVCGLMERIKTIPSSMEGYREIVVKTVIR